MKKRYYLDLHVIQTVPPSCMNRDDMGTPKTAVYGGTTRARVSSQAWKHAMRVMFKDLFAPTELGERTKHIAEMIAEKLRPMMEGTSFLGVDEAKVMKRAAEAIQLAGIKASSKDPSQVAALFFMSNAQAKALAQLCAEDSKDKEAYKRALKENPSADIALFGRMVADDPSLNYDAAAQVAHAISTHTVHNEFDYFTAVDDRSPEDNAGAGHLGTLEFHSSTLYRYATLNLGELSEHLAQKDEIAKAVRNFVDAFIRSMPTGRQNSYANRTFPNAIYVTLREDQPVNLCGAFEKPVRQSDEGYVTASVKALVQEAQTVYANFAAEPVQAWCVGGGLEQLGAAMSLPDLLAAVSDTVASLFEVQ